MSKDDLKLTSDRNLDKVETYEFDLPPIKGFPELRWAGKRPFRSTHYYPAQLKENHGEPVDGWMNEIYWGDNLQVMSHLLKKYRGQIKLIYIDPPFDSKADYKKKIQLKGKTVANDQNVFEEKQYTDIWTNDEYLQFMYERLILMRELLADDGSIYLHCDWHKVHLLRIIIEEIFGFKNFKNEVVWQRFNFRADGKKFGAVHDSILFMTKTPNYIYNQQYWPLKESYIKSHFRKDEKGRYYRLDNLSAPSHGSPGKPLQFGKSFISPPHGTMWRFKQETITELWKQGKIVLSNNGIPQVVRYLDEIQGQAIHSVWTDNRSINSQSVERLNYPTQKPEKLLERIINTSSNSGDIVFDCFMGSGTTQAVAMKLGRRFIGADINLGAIQITTKRLLQVAKELTPREAEKQNYEQGLLVADRQVPYGKQPVYYTGFAVYNVNNYDIFRNPVQAKELLIEALEIQKLPGNIVFDGEKDGRMVKILPINRIATRADLNELIANLDYKAFEKRQTESPGKPVEHITLVCMGHEPDLAAAMQEQVHYKLDIEVVDILRDRQDIQFKRDSEAEIVRKKNKLIIKEFYPMNLLRKLSLMKENVKDWKEMVESVMIDFNYDGVVFEPREVDVPEKKELVKGVYEILEDASTIRVKITDLLSESLEMDVK